MNDTMKIEYISDAPSQVNSWDCGIYVICFSQAVIEKYLSGSLGDLKEQSVAMFAHMNPKYIEEQRCKIRQLLQEMI